MAMLNNQMVMGFAMGFHGISQQSWEYHGDFSQLRLREERKH
jgi:hypothetical protein